MDSNKPPPSALTPASNKRPRESTTCLPNSLPVDYRRDDSGGTLTPIEQEQLRADAWHYREDTHD